MSVLLKCCTTENATNYEDIAGDVEWILKQGLQLPDPVESSITNVQMWSFYSILAEICLHLAKLLGSSHEKESALFEEGIRLSKLADPKMKDIDGNITNPIAYTAHVRILSELQCLQNPV